EGRAEGWEVEAGVGGPAPMDGDRELGLRLLEARLDVRDAPDPAHRRRQLTRDAVELVHVGASHAELDRLLPKGSRLEEAVGEPRHLLDHPPGLAEDLAERLAGSGLELHVRAALVHRAIGGPRVPPRPLRVLALRRALLPPH